MKKKFYYAGMLAAGLLTFASCNNDDDPIIEQNQVQTEEDAQVIRIAVANAGDGLTTKAGRPLSSADATQDIDEVKIVIVNSADNKIVAVHKIENWMATSSEYSDDGHGQEYSWKLSKDEMLTANGTFRAYAVGYTNPGSYKMTINDATNGSIDFLTGIEQTTPLDNPNYTLDWVNAEMTSLGSGSGQLGEEIFAGAIDLTTNVDGEFEGDNVLTLHRQVTGTIGYFTNIPTYKSGTKNKIFGVVVPDGQDGYKYSQNPTVSQEAYNAYVAGLKLQLVVSNLNDGIKMSGFNSSFRETGENVQFVVNGYQTTNFPSAVTTAKFVDSSDPAKLTAISGTEGDGYVAYSIMLNEWFKNGDVSDVDFAGFVGNGFLNVDDAQGNNWVSPEGFDGPYQRGSVFAGQFMMPVLKDSKKHQTMQLQLVATVAISEDGGGQIIGENEVVRAWDISLPENDEQVWSVYDTENRHVETINAQGEAFPTVGAEYEELTDSYSLVRNHLYTVGSISEDENIPEDLSKTNALILRVNDNWEMIHQMVVD